MRGGGPRESDKLKAAIESCVGSMEGERDRTVLRRRTETLISLISKYEASIRRKTVKRG